ncbi:conserved hypothetical protein [Cyanobium sp. PCC 7001]|uniref:hypothetical protein n=1 Tax=Cyanobium sp. PCC 7001 TaxID=180281 RepID=UPI00018057CB|nr:hypothetical protein [Cyanobium sp. PCC 7001]EDY38434.1 conserved hypothetical protein [Cyanobium sp. PCC 7001]
MSVLHRHHRSDRDADRVVPDPLVSARPTPGVLALLLGGLLLLPGQPVSAGATGSHGSGAPPSKEPIALRCRDRQGPWRDCQMLVDSVGERWSLILDDQRIEFRHDGRGSVTMQRPSPSRPTSASPWIPVEARWSEEPALCWDGICAQGDIPLD